MNPVFGLTIFVIAVYGVLQARTASILNKEDDNDSLNTNSIETEDRNHNNNSNSDLLYREQYAKKMISYMNQNMDPCDDFYEYACGNWKNTLEKRHSPYRRCNIIDIYLELSANVEELMANPDKNLALKYADELQQARTLHELCLNANLFPLTKSNEYLEVIRNITGFPALDESWQADDFDWFNATAHFQIYGVTTFVKETPLRVYNLKPLFMRLPNFGFDVIVNSDNIASNKTSAYILNEQRMRQYLTIYGVADSKISEVIHAVFELWLAIFKVTDEFENKKEKCLKLGRTKYDIQTQKWDKWNSYLEIVWNRFSGAPSECPCAYFYMKLDQICTERKEAVANYMAMKFLYHMDAKLEGNDMKVDYCNQKIMTHMRFLLDQLYMEEISLQSIQQESETITQHIRTILRQHLPQLSWLDETTREEALLKESTLNLHLGRFVDDKVIEQFIGEMKKMHIEQSNYERTNLNLVKFTAYMSRYPGINGTNSTLQLSQYQYLGMDIKAFFGYSENTINIPAGILNPPIYHKSWPLSLKYGTLGYLIGHELFHTFDTYGTYFDSKGELGRWLTYDSMSAFNELINCYVNKFNAYEIPVIRRKVNGDLTKNENIGDHAGLHFSFNAYKHHMQLLGRGKNTTNMSIPQMDYMPHLNLTSEQLFFLGFAQIWCADYKEKDYWNQLDNLHSVDKFRVLGTLSNIKEFSEAFNCPIGSKMNTNKNKCEMW